MDKPKKDRRIRRSPAEAREQIFAAVSAALEEQDFGELTVAAVTQRAGMTRSAFYHYFSGLDELALGLLEQFEDSIKSAVNPWLEGEYNIDDYRGATRRHLTDMYRVFDAHRNSVRAVFQAASVSQRVFEEWQARVVDYYIDKTAIFIRRQIALGRSRVTDPERTAKALLLMNNAVGNDNLLRAAPDDPVATGRVIADVWNATIFDRKV